MPIRSGLRLRLTALVVLSGALTAAVALVGLSVLVGGRLDAAVDAGLRARADDIRAALAQGDAAAPGQDPFAQVVDHSDRVISHSAGAPGKSVLSGTDLAAATHAPLTVMETVPTLRGPARLLAERGPGHVVVVVGTGLADFDEAQDRLLLALGIALVLLVMLAGGGAWVVVGAALRPVARMSRAAEATSGHDPHAQLPQPPGNDEIALLGRTLNGLLRRIAGFVDRERAFLDDASHELRTPLTVVRGELELALDDPDPERARAGVQRALAEAESLSLLADDLLVLARQRGGDLALAREAVDLGSWLVALVRQLEPAWSCRVHVVAPDPVTVWLDPDRFRRVIVNLLTNASAAGATQVRLSVCSEDAYDGPRSPAAKWTVLEVADDGPGFDPAVLPRVFLRFARGDTQPSSAETSSGAGLGLAIVAALVDAHGGRVLADNRSPLGGARVQVLLPVGPPGP